MMPENLIARNGFLLIARRNGSSSSRRQRRFPDMAAVDRAVDRWRKQGYNVWFIFGPAVDGQRGLVRSWVE